MHLSFALSGFIRSQVPHFHPSLSDGGFSPAALQSNSPPVPLLAVAVVEGAGPNPVKLGLNADPTGLEAPNENPDEVVDDGEDELDAPNRSGPEGGVGIEKTSFEPETEMEEEEPGFGVSQKAHFSFDDTSFINSQVPHFHSSVFVVGGCKPAALQSNPPEPELVEDVETAVSVVVELAPNENGVEGGLGIEKEDATGFAAPGLGVSHTVHFSVAEGGFAKSQVPHFHTSSCFGGFKPAAPQLNPPFVVGAVVVEFETGRTVTPAL